MVDSAFYIYIHNPGIIIQWLEYNIYSLSGSENNWVENSEIKGFRAQSLENVIKF